MEKQTAEKQEKNTAEDSCEADWMMGDSQVLLLIPVCLSLISESEVRINMADDRQNKIVEPHAKDKDKK